METESSVPVLSSTSWPRLSRRQFLLGLSSALFGAFMDARYVEPFWFEVNEIDVPFFRTAGSRALRVLHLSDLHLSSLVPLEQISRAIDLGLSKNPEIICLTGDYITAHVAEAQFEEYAKVLRKLSEHAPTFAVLGNHDGGTWANKRYGIATPERVVRLLENSGVRVLQNQQLELAVGGRHFFLVGLQDYWMKPWAGSNAFQGLSAAQDVIVLSHNPDSKAAVAHLPWNLMLSGHTHGGQCRIPLLGITPYAPVSDMRYVAGLNPWGSRWIHTTKGVGNILGLRLNCRPEVSLLRLV